MSCILDNPELAREMKFDYFEALLERAFWWKRAENLRRLVNIISWYRREDVILPGTPQLRQHKKAAIASKAPG